MRHPAVTALALIAIATQLPAQDSAATRQAASIPPAHQQIAAAVLPLPKDLRESATVIGYSPAGVLTTLRAGRGEMICLASDPKGRGFHVACYHRSMEPFMARGRALRASGTSGDQVDSVRFREVREGKLKVPTGASMLYSLTGPKDAYDAATQTAPKARHLFVVYIPFATGESTGLSAVPVQGAPWVMFPGTPKAHIMFVPGM